MNRYWVKGEVPSDVVGITRWQATAEHPAEWGGTSWDDWFGDEWVSPDASRDRLKSKSNRPRVFVSYKKDDYKEAKDVVEEAERADFDYWLDVEDPILNAIGNLSGPQHSIAIASVIEVALLNCSHVVAIITDQTRGSMWVPYEYSRIKED